MQDEQEEGGRSGLRSPALPAPGLYVGILTSTFEGFKLGCAKEVSCFFSAVTFAVCIGHWTGWREQKQEAPLTQ